MKNVSQKKIRLDELLVGRGYFPDADQALCAVIAHEVKVDDVCAALPLCAYRPMSKWRLQSI